MTRYEWIDQAAIAIMAGFAADPNTTSTEPAGLAKVAYAWADALEAEKRKREDARQRP